jgi:hypothetical protein
MVSRTFRNMLWYILATPGRCSSRKKLLELRIFYLIDRFIFVSMFDRAYRLPYSSPIINESIFSWEMDPDLGFDEFD